MKRLSTILVFSMVLVGALVLETGTFAGASAPGTALSPRSAGWGMMAGYGSSSMMGSRQQRAIGLRPLSINQAQQRVQLYITRYGNPHLVIDEIIEFQHNFYAIVKDKSTGHGAFEVLVDKVSGLVLPEYGPSMMWNTQYGMVSGGMIRYQHPSGPMTISSKQAARLARQWLAHHRSGTTIETPDQFPGYYTVHFHKNGKIAGMLSVNGHSGQIWYHNWHGSFIRMKTVAG